jgi:hypothetical protein
VAEVPEPVRRYLEALHLNPAPKPDAREEKLPGFTTPVWHVNVIDEGTGEVIRVIIGYPVAEYGRYRIVRITNKRGYPVNVLTFAEEAPKVEVPLPTPEEVKSIRAESERAVPVRPYRAPVDWRRMDDVASKILEWVSACERHVEAKNAFAIQAYMKTIQDIAGEAKSHLVEAGAEVLKTHERRAEVPVKVLTDEEYAVLWDIFARTLKEAGLDPAKYRSRFEDVVAWNLDFGGNEMIVMDEARAIIAEAGLRRKRYIDTLPEKPIRFSWKYVGWGLSSIRLDAEMLRECIRVKDALGAYMALTRILNAAEKLKIILRMAPGI